MTEKLVLLLSGAFFGLIFAFNPLKVRRIMTKIKWFFPLLLLYMFIIIVMPADVLITDCLKSMDDKSPLFTVVVNAAEAGIGIYIAVIAGSHIISKVLIKIIQSEKGNNLSQEDIEKCDNLLKTLFTILIPLNLLFPCWDALLIPINGNYSIIRELPLSKVCTWIITVIGTWLGIGFRPDEKFFSYRALSIIRENIQSMELTAGLLITFLFTIVCNILQISQSEAGDMLYMCIGIFLVSMFAIMLPIIAILYPEKYLSNLYFSHVIWDLNRGSNISGGRYGFLRYKVCRYNFIGNALSDDYTERYEFVIQEDEWFTLEGDKRFYLGELRYNMPVFDKQRIISVLKEISEKRRLEKNRNNVRYDF